LTGNADEAEAMFELGFNFTAVGNDVTLLASMADNLAARFRKK
jgi:2-keto-3-deoxy-L-rhamnonate aldolase RhmA